MYTECMTIYITSHFNEDVMVYTECMTIYTTSHHAGLCAFQLSGSLE